MTLVSALVGEAHAEGGEQDQYDDDDEHQQAVPAPVRRGDPRGGTPHWSWVRAHAGDADRRGVRDFVMWRASRLGRRIAVALVVCSTVVVDEAAFCWSVVVPSMGLCVRCADDASNANRRARRWRPWKPLVRSLGDGER